MISCLTHMKYVKKKTSELLGGTMAKARLAVCANLQANGPNH